MSTTRIKDVESRRQSAQTVPPLEDGDRLSRAEFERRFDAMPGLEKAELIEGIVHMPSPVRIRHHGSPHANLITWLGVYAAASSGVVVADNGSIRLDLDDMLQPDALLLVPHSHGGQTKIGEDGYVEGAPQLVAEVESSSVSVDLHAKRTVYRRNGVREYIVWRVDDGAIDWFILRNGVDDRLALDTEGRYRSGVFPGLWLDPAALAEGKLLTVLAQARQGLGTPEHAAFVAGLAEARARPAR